MNYETAMNDHYGQRNLSANIIRALAQAGREIDSHGDTASFDEFHIRGREATRELARLAGLQRGMKVLDLGCGIGGPARTLAAEFGCHVTGMDLVEAYCRTARMLSDRVGLRHMTTFYHGNIMTPPFDEQIFDGVWTAHVIMNIQDKKKLFGTVRRMLRSKGLLALYEICAGAASPPYFPVPWASDSTINFLVPPGHLRHIIKNAGFIELQWRDVSELSLEWLRGSMKWFAACQSDTPQPIGLNLLMGVNTAEKIRNVLRNLEEDRIRVVQGVFRRGD